MDDAPRPQAVTRWRRVFKGASLLFSLLCLAWVLWPIVTNGRQLAEVAKDDRLLLWLTQCVVVGTVAYAVLSVFLAVGWWWLAGVYGDRPSLREGYAVFARSQLAKYLPGNAFQFVSRQILGRRTGLSHPALVASGFLEIGTQLLAALIAAGVAYSQARQSTGVATLVPAWGWIILAAAICLLAWPALDTLLRRLPKTAAWMEDLPHLSLPDTLRLLGPALLCYVAFFLGTGLILWLVAGPLAGHAADFGWKVLGIYPLAWMAGTVTVGAPAGVGVREAVLTLELGTVMTPAQAAVAALALRLVTLGGDLLSALSGWWLDRADARRA